MDWHTALRTLEQGNARFAGGATPAAHTQERRQALLETQTPLAAVLGCADSRVPPEIIFDVGLGDLFVVRVAGHVLDETIAASLGFAVETLGVPVVVVLGHEGCAAVRAALAPENSPTWLRPVTARVAAAAALAEKPENRGKKNRGKAAEEPNALDAAIEAHALQVAAAVARVAVVRPHLASGRARVVPAVYSLRSGLVRWLATPDPTAP
ncbi:MAG: carbonic anhydrase [Actinobacteria bacterium]|nr:carbonic anhydrase [Actinomycetota bacterium]